MSRLIDAEELERVAVMVDGRLVVHLTDIHNAPTVECTWIISGKRYGKKEEALKYLRPHGKWIICNQDNAGIHKIECPFCKYVCGSDFSDHIKVTFDKLPNFCEDCGADMRGGKEK